jgi:predicted nucleic acid-binding protein
MSFVIDASATLPWRFEDEATPWTEALLDRAEQGEELVVPAHWALEVANGLLMALRRKRVTAEQVSEFTEDLAALAIVSEPADSPARWTAIIGLAQEYRLTVYDAAYIELARRADLPLASLDRALIDAARAAGVDTIPTQA